MIIFSSLDWLIGMDLKFVDWIHPIVLTTHDEGGYKIMQKMSQNRGAHFLSHPFFK